MKINKIFHTLYFMVMMLPLFIIPIFAININQKSVDPISITVNESYWEVQNKYETNEVNNLDDLILGNAYTFSSDDGLEIPYDEGANFSLIILDIQESNLTQIVNGSDIADTSIFGDGNYTNITFYLNVLSSDEAYDLYLYVDEDSDIFYEYYIDSGNYIKFTEFTFVITSGLTSFKTNYQLHAFGHSEINEAQYNILEYVYHENTPVVYDDTDIGSQFLYSLYKPVNDYFNFSNYFGLNGIYDWFQMNWFNGTAPLSFFIFYNLMIYWLIISLLWLLFDVLIYVPLLIHRWLDKASVS